MTNNKENEKENVVWWSGWFGVEPNITCTSHKYLTAIVIHPDIYHTIVVVNGFSIFTSPLSVEGS